MEIKRFINYLQQYCWNCSCFYEFYQQLNFKRLFTRIVFMCFWYTYVNWWKENLWETLCYNFKLKDREIVSNNQFKGFKCVLINISKNCLENDNNISNC